MLLVSENGKEKRRKRDEVKILYVECKWKKSGQFVKGVGGEGVCTVKSWKINCHLQFFMELPHVFVV